MKEKCSEFFVHKLPGRLKQLSIVAVFLLANCFFAMAQTGVKVSGVVTADTDGFPLIGVNVVQKGTTNGSITDIDGKFELTVPVNSTIVLTYIGFINQEVVVVAGKTQYDIILKEDTQSLEEVVVVGYGVQKKRLVTGATINVKGDDIQKMSSTNTFTALQAQTPGVNITQNNGQPGAGYIINIRGVATNGNSKPLYIIDGVPSGDDALNHMSPSDIESIDILKDAASSAIYGARAANGVVLVTTKKGKAGKSVLSYDASFGSQYMSKKPNLLNAKEYILFQNEKQFNMNGASQWADWENLLPAGMYDDVMSERWNGSDWIDAFYNKGAAIQNHAINLTGGSELSKFSMGYSFSKQDGIFGEGAAQPNYTRHTARINSDHVLLKVKDFDAIKIGQTLNYIYRQNNGIAQGNMYWNDFTQLMRANPLMPIFNEDGSYYDQPSKDRDGWRLDPNQGNPIGTAAKSARGLNLNKNHALNVSAFLEIQPIKNLIFKSQYGYRMNANAYRSFDEITHWSNASGAKKDMETVNQSSSIGYNWTFENTLTYNFSVNDHNVTLLVGQTAEKWGYGEEINAGADFSNFSGLGWNYAWVNNYVPTQLTERRAGGSPWNEGALLGYLGRAMYNYKETYIATLTMRADGSANFAKGNRWGYFPSVSGGWVMSNESFMEDLIGKIDFLRLSASWGRNGNSSIDNFTYLTQFRFSGMPLTYYFGDGSKTTPYAGAASQRLPNPGVTWETQQMLDLGFTARFLKNRLGVDFNYYNATTKDWLLEMPISATWGFGDPIVNGGDVSRYGYELSLNWNDNISDFNYGVNLNGSYNTSEVTRINNPEGVIHGDANVLSQTTSEFYRLQVGHKMGIFYGYKTNGILQNWNEANAYNATTGENAVPGDVRFVDVDGNGKIDDEDRTKIGCGWPTFKAGFTLTASYKGFDFMMVTSGAFGFDIAKSYRSFADNETANYTTDAFDRWTGEGTSNKWPRLTVGNHINYQRVSDIFLEKGDYVKIQNITIGYDVKRLFPKIPLGQARVYLTGQNLFTFTSYSGMDPEVGYGHDKSWMSGIDVGTYPSAKSFLCGVQLTF